MANFLRPEDFWEFATSIPRCASVASRESTRLRGSWITPELVVQRVHGYSDSAGRCGKNLRAAVERDEEVTSSGVD